MSIQSSGPWPWRTRWMDENKEESGEEKEDEEDKERSRKSGTVKKGIMANAQVKSNRKWNNRNSLVELGILGHWDGNEEVENVREWVKSQKGGTIDTIVTYKSQITSYALPQLPSFLPFIILLLFHRSQWLCMVKFTKSLKIYPLHICSTFGHLASASVSPFVQQAKFITSPLGIWHPLV